MPLISDLERLVRYAVDLDLLPLARSGGQQQRLDVDGCRHEDDGFHLERVAEAHWRESAERS